MTAPHDRVRELRATLMETIAEEACELQDEEWDEDVEVADFYMKTAVAHRIHGLLGRDEATIEAEIGCYRSAMEEAIVMKVVERNALGRMRAVPREVLRAVH